MQTFAPEHYVIQAAAQHDVKGFYQHELDQRKRLGLSAVQPTRATWNIETAIRSKRKMKRKKLSAKLQKQIEFENLKSISMIGPAPCFFSKLGGDYRWQIILRGSDPASFLRGRVPDHWRVEVEPVSLL